MCMASSSTTTALPKKTDSALVTLEGPGAWGLGFLWTLVIGNWNLEPLIRICHQPFAQAGQRERQELLDFRAIQGSVWRPGRAVVILARGRLEMRIELRPARSDELAHLPTRQALNAREVIEAGLALRDQFPNRARRYDRGHGRAKFIDEQLQRFSRLPGAAHLFVESAIAGRRRAAVQRDSDDGVLGVCQDDLLGGNFGLGINTQRIGPGGLVVVSLSAVKNQIAGEENKWNVGGQLGQASGGFNIQLPRQRRIILASRA